MLNRKCDLWKKCTFKIANCLFGEQRGWRLSHKPTGGSFVVHFAGRVAGSTGPVEGYSLSRTPLGPPARFACSTRGSRGSAGSSRGVPRAANARQVLPWLSRCAGRVRSPVPPVDEDVAGRLRWLYEAIG